MVVEGSSPDLVWQVRRSAEPSLLFTRCAACRARCRMRCTHRFRVNANQRLIDVWLLFHCARCGQTVRLPVLRRRRTSSITPADLESFQRNDRRLAVALLSDAALLAREGFDVLRAPPPIDGATIGAADVRGRSGTSRARVEGAFDTLEDVLAAVLPFGRGACRRLLRSGAIRRVGSAVDAVELEIDWDELRVRLGPRRA